MQAAFLRVNSGLRAILLLLALLAPFASVPANAQDREHPASGLPVPRSRLTPEEVDRAIRIATDGAVTSRSQAVAESRSSLYRATAERAVLTSVRMTVGNKDEPDSLFAIVTTYNYERHETTRRLVDLARESVVWERSANDGSAPLAAVETGEAMRLALEDTRVRQLLGASLEGVKLEVLNPTIGDTGHALFGKRVALILFKNGNEYLAGLPAVFANLTDAAVFIEE